MAVWGRVGWLGVGGQTDIDKTSGTEFRYQGGYPSCVSVFVSSFVFVAFCVVRKQGVVLAQYQDIVLVV